RDLQPRRLAAVLGIVLVLGGARTALRVPIWRNDRTVALSMLRDAPWSYRSHDYTGWQLYWARDTERALGSWLLAGRIFDRDQGVFLAGAIAAYSLGRPHLADSLLALANKACASCPPRIATWPAPPGSGGTPSPPIRCSPAPRACRHRDRRA